jgi:hypothetical protein
MGYAVGYFFTVLYLCYAPLMYSQAIADNAFCLAALAQKEVHCVTLLLKLASMILRTGWYRSPRRGAFDDVSFHDAIGFTVPYRFNTGFLRIAELEKCNAKIKLSQVFCESVTRAL